MKTVKTSLLLSIFAATLSSVISLSSSASQWYGFCYGKTTKTICTPIIEKPADMGAYCSNWAQSHSASMWGNHTGTSVSVLQAKQAVKCQEILGGGGGGGLPTSYQCYVEVLCPGPTGDTSSISQTPVGGSVTAPNANLAAKKCVQNYSNFYLNSLKENVGMSCYIKATTN
jgi:hypothetical protein